MGIHRQWFVSSILGAWMLALLSPAFAGQMELRVSLRDRSAAEVLAAPKRKGVVAKRAEEAIRTLDAIRDALGRWYGDRSAAERAAATFRFPASTPWSPAELPCPPGPSMLSPQSVAWKHATWRAIGFKMETAHRYQYRIVSVGRGAEASFSIQARGDLDCNGRRSLLRLTGDARGGKLHTRLLRLRHPRE